MECNKDEAMKAKVISEQKLIENDFAGAMKFALKAQALYPGMDGLSQLVTIINVCVSAEKKVGQRGEVDWYGVLGVTTTADDETIKKQYRKIALMVHPDKNKCSRADGAFKLVSEAWSLLSDKAKRCAYDQRRISNVISSNISVNNNKSSSSSSSSTSVPRQNVCRVCHTRHDTFVAECKYCKKSQVHLNRYRDTSIFCIHCVRCVFMDSFITRRCSGAPKPVPPDLEDRLDNTFLTTCAKCHTRQEHLKEHRRKILTCSHCRNPFTIATAENGVPQRANNVGMKRPREEAQGAGGGCDRRDKLAKLRVVAREYLKFPIYARIENPHKIEQDLSKSSGLSLELAGLCRSLLQLGIYDSLKGPEPSKRKFTFKTPLELKMLRDCLTQELRGRENWNRVASVLRASNLDLCKEEGIKIQKSEGVNQPTLDELLIGYGVDGSPAIMDWSLITVPPINHLEKIVKEFSKIPIAKRIRNTHDFDMELATITGLSIHVVKFCRLILHLGIYESLSVPEPQKRKPDFKLSVERMTLRACVVQEIEGCEDWDRIARIMGLKDFMVGMEAWESLKVGEAARTGGLKSKCVR